MVVASYLITVKRLEHTHLNFTDVLGAAEEHEARGVHHVVAGVRGLQPPAFRNCGLDRAASATVDWIALILSPKLV